VKSHGSMLLAVRRENVFQKPHQLAIILSSFLSCKGMEGWTNGQPVTWKEETVIIRPFPCAELVRWVLQTLQSWIIQFSLHLQKCVGQFSLSLITKETEAQRAEMLYPRLHHVEGVQPRCFSWAGQPGASCNPGADSHAHPPNSLSSVNPASIPPKDQHLHLLCVPQPHSGCRTLQLLTVIQCKPPTSTARSPQRGLIPPTAFAPGQSTGHVCCLLIASLSLLCIPHPPAHGSFFFEWQVEKKSIKVKKDRTHAWVGLRKTELLQLLPVLSLDSCQPDTSSLGHV
jgi:hypothetical protein